MYDLLHPLIGQPKGRNPPLLVEDIADGEDQVCEELLRTEAPDLGDMDESNGLLFFV